MGRRWRSERGCLQGLRAGPVEGRQVSWRGGLGFCAAGRPGAKRRAAHRKRGRGGEVPPGRRTERGGGRTARFRYQDAIGDELRQVWRSRHGACIIRLVVLAGMQVNVDAMRTVLGRRETAG